jgi:hypothetical protein
VALTSTLRLVIEQICIRHSAAGKPNLTPSPPTAVISQEGGTAANCLTLGGVTTVESAPEPELPVLPPEEALRRARPLPRRAQLVVEGVSPEEWGEFQQALTEE